ncbi:MAG: glycosyltransferase family 39 protein [Anaerolineaceae bacterium]|nr:glycosyltransferase family 39 protein [Anaerolineaceae bacterium]
MTRNKLLTQLALAGLILITLSIYYPPFAWAFVGDDYVQFDYIKEVIANPWMGLALFNPYYSTWYYRPLQLAWFAILEGVFHFLPNGFYWTELLFQALAVALVYRVARQMKLSPFTAVLTAALFAIHSHWVDVVSWLSSIAIVLAAVFSLLAVSAWLSYLKRPSTRQLLLTFLFCLLTFLSHEESVLLPPFLLLILLVQRWEMGDWRLKGRSIISNLQSLISKELLLFTTLGLITAAYLYVQFTRPNFTIDIGSRATAEWFTFLSWPEIAEFIIVTVFRFTFILDLLELSGTAASLFATTILLLLGLWFWWGGRTVRLGLAWLGLHLAFIYWALWTQLPELYAGRHIYQAMIGLVLAIGASLETLLREDFLPQRTRKAQRKNKNPFRSLRPLQFIKIAALLVVTAVSLHHLNQTQNTQQLWLNNVTEEAAARQQLAELFPTISPESHFFAVRFPIAPQFTRSVVQLWYDTPLERPGGSLDHLRAAGRADRNFVVLDYADGQVYNLMPELQQHDETIFLWAQPSQRVWVAEDGAETAVPDPDTSLPIVEAQNGSELAIKMTPQNGRWLSHHIIATIPPNSELHTAILPRPGLRYRLRLRTPEGEEMTLLDTSEGKAESWQPVTVPLEAYAGTAVTLSFEIWREDAAEDVSGYWANPRLVVDESG